MMVWSDLNRKISGVICLTLHVTNNVFKLIQSSYLNSNNNTEQRQTICVRWQDLKGHLCPSTCETASITRVI